MRKLLYCLSLFLSFAWSYAADGDWGQTGHRATGEIAQNHLSRKAKKAIEKLLKGQSLAVVSTYGDDIKSDPEYRKYGPWHYVNMEPGESNYNPDTANPEGDIIFAINKCIAVLEDNASPTDEKEFYLKMLVHFMGDLHQPFHVGKKEDKGGNDIQVRWFNEGSNIHRVWDSDMINSYQMSYTELAENTQQLSDNQIRQIAGGTLEDWMFESKDLATRVYASAEVGEKLGYRYMYDWFPVVQEQLQKGGIRLAQVLNKIYK